MLKPKVFVARRIPAAGLDRVIAECDADVWQDPMPPSREVILDKVRGCDGILSLLTDTMDAAVFDAAGPGLKVVSNMAVGYNNINTSDAFDRGIRIGNTPGVLTEATADMAVTLLLAAARCLREGIENVSARQWKNWEPLGFIGQDLGGKTIGIVGMGRIGLATAERLHRGWGMKVVYASRTAKPDAEHRVSAVRLSLDALLEQSDFVSVHTDLNESTLEMFDASAFKAMKSTAVFVNTSRGGIHVSEDLHDALVSGEIFAAGLDVTNPEPPSSDDPLLDLPNCVVAPHIGSATVSARNGMASIAAANLIAGVRGENLPHEVIPEN
ncbi:MAG: D-glycerate dehydrogenase [Rhodothermales bacterium]|nr:D-glycerate dehydrogenase [Rhodothermales bacterium]